ncbi:MAG: glycosyltransferase family 4 protein [Rudaea sp.]
MQQRDSIRILFYSLADRNILSFYNLNAREIAANLDPQRFACTFFLSGLPDDRLSARKSVNFIPLPRRFGKAVMARELIFGDYDVLYAPPTDRVMDLYRSLKVIGRPKRTVELAAVSAGYLMAMPLAHVRRRVRVMAEADRVVAISPFVADGFSQQFGIRSCVIPLPVPFDFFKRPDRRKPAGRVQVLFVGRIEEQKQPHLLLDFARSIPANQAEFHLVGNLQRPSYSAGLLARKQAEHLDHVYFHGSQPQNQVREWMWRSDIFVLPSRLEGAPRVTVEAAAAGLPCIVFDDYQTPTVLDGMTGFHVHTEQEMEQRLKQLIHDEDLRLKMGAAAAEHAKQFDSRIVGKQWEQLFAELVAEKA